MKKNFLLNYGTNKNAITLISLIITVILLLILAGVTLNLTLGNNGIFTLSKNASKNYINAQDKELADLEKLYSEMKIATNDGSQITVNVEDLKKIIQEEVNKQIYENSLEKSYGYFYSDFLTNVSNDSIFSFETKEGNIAFNNTNKSIHLEKGKHYYINFSARLFANSSNYGEFILYNSNKSSELKKINWANSGAWLYNCGSLIYTPEENTDIIIKFTSQSNVERVTEITLTIYEI